MHLLSVKAVGEDEQTNGPVLCVVVTEAVVWDGDLQVLVVVHGVDMPEARAAVRRLSFLGAMATVLSGVGGGVITSSGITRFDALFFGG